VSGHHFGTAVLVQPNNDAVELSNLRPLFQCAEAQKVSSLLEICNRVSRGTLLRRCIAALTIALCAGGWAASQVRDTPTLEDVRRAQLDRVGKIDTVKMSWNGETLRMNSSDPDAPETPITTIASAKLAIAGSSTWIRQDKEIWNASRKEVQSDYVDIATFHDGIGKSLRPNRGDGNVLTRNEVTTYIVSKVLTMSYRADAKFLTAPNMAVLRIEATNDGERVVLGNTNFYDDVASGQSIPNRNRREYYLYPARDFILTKYVARYRDGRIRGEATVNYSKDEAGGFVPEEIIYVGYSGDKSVRIRHHFFVEEFVLNDVIDPALFELEFPPGTRVSDEILGTEYIVGKNIDIDDAMAWVDQTLADITDTGTPSKSAALQVAPPQPESATPLIPAPGEDAQDKLPRRYILAAALLGALLLAAAATTYARRAKSKRR